MTGWWMVTVAAEGAAAIAFLLVALLVARNLGAGRQWTFNPLGVATLAVFVSVAAAQGAHAVWGLRAMRAGGEAAHAAADLLSGPMTLAWAVVTAAVVMWYFQRGRHLVVLRGRAALVEDMRRKEGDARRLQMDVLQKVRAAQDCLAAGDVERCTALVDETLLHAKRIVAELLPVHGDVRPGSVRREGALG